MVKYDLLTALGAHACAGDKNRQRLVLRLITLIVARYNWIADEISVGQREMAALWSIDERSVKRDLARFRELGWLVVKRPAARGRVAVHGLDQAAIFAASRDDWGRVGPDFVNRMTGPSHAEQPDAPASNVVTFPVQRPGAGTWLQLQARLHREDPHSFGAWFAALQCDETEEGILRLSAPSRFHADYLRDKYLVRLQRLAETVDPAIRRVEIDCL